jgi:hypothetical protein
VDLVKTGKGSLLADRDLVDPIHRSELECRFLSKAGLEVTLLETPGGVLFATGLLGMCVALLAECPFTSGVLLSNGDALCGTLVGVALLDRTGTPFGTAVGAAGEF